MSMLRIRGSMQHANRSNELRNIERLNPFPDCHRLHS